MVGISVPGLKPLLKLILVGVLAHGSHLDSNCYNDFSTLKNFQLQLELELEPKVTVAINQF